jgi:hypothetical protein
MMAFISAPVYYRAEDVGIGAAVVAERKLRDTERQIFCTAERADELPPADANCHFPRPQWDHAQCNVGHDITAQSAGL